MDARRQSLWVIVLALLTLAACGPDAGEEESAGQFWKALALPSGQALAALLMSASTVIVAINAQLMRRQQI
jgi:hypothetical protein